eukprot:GHVP01055184.1.p1 GENE.GHVP01055184.1~~GHVP01055184.1.p1  ORF type:complete len:156 (-),score=33.61 GHVP01055184.1:100-567(-)
MRFIICLLFPLASISWNSKDGNSRDLKLSKVDTGLLSWNFCLNKKKEFDEFPVKQELYSSEEDSEEDSETIAAKNSLSTPLKIYDVDKETLENAKRLNKIIRSQNTSRVKTNLKSYDKDKNSPLKTKSSQFERNLAKNKTKGQKQDIKTFHTKKN